MNWKHILIAAALYSTGCQNSQRANQETTQVINSNALPSAAGIQGETVQKILNECTHIDFTFHNKPVSMSQSDKQSVLNDLGSISTEAMTEIPSECQPTARKVYWGPEGIIIEADLYITDGCAFVVFIKDERKLYANQLNEKGKVFYGQVLQQVEQSGQ